MLAISGPPEAAAEDAEPVTSEPGEVPDDAAVEAVPGGQVVVSAGPPEESA